MFFCVISVHEGGVVIFPSFLIKLRLRGWLCNSVVRHLFSKCLVSVLSDEVEEEKEEEARY